MKEKTRLHSSRAIAGFGTITRLVKYGMQNLICIRLRMNLVSSLLTLRGLVEGKRERNLLGLRSIFRETFLEDWAL